MKICEYCNTEFEPKRSDARFCNIGCKSRHHYEHKGEEMQPEVSLMDTLKGVVDESVSNVAEQVTEQVVMKAEKVETSEYIGLRKHRLALLNKYNQQRNEIEKLKKEKAIIQMENGIIIPAAGGTAGIILGATKYKKGWQVLLSGAAGVGLGMGLKSITKDIREADKQERLQKIIVKIQALIVYYTDNLAQLREMDRRIALVQRYETRMVPSPAVSLPIPQQPRRECQPEPSKLQPPVAAASPKLNDLHDYYSSNPISLSSKVITVKQLAETEYRAFEFTGRWNKLFGQPLEKTL
ncbi:MAG: hypothetical protein WCM76_05425 [Bacteroidota bacterium]